MEIKKIILIIIITNIGLLQAQYTAIPDGGFEQALINQGIDSEGLFDGQVLTSDINTITILGVGMSSIFSLDGIQDFVLLEELFCGFNYIDTLNLTNNLNLKYLSCEYNLLTSLNLNSNTLLEYLHCNYNQITTLDIENCTSLIGLEYVDNFLDNINFTNFPDLTSFNAAYNQISTIDISQNLNLRSVILSHNNITELSLDFHNDIRSVFINNNDLNYLSVKNNNNQIITIFNTTYNPNLNCIFVDNAVNSTTNWLDVDNTSAFVETQTACDALATPNYTIENSVNIYPNPTQSYFKINTNATIKKIGLYNIFGKLIKTFKYQDNYMVNNIEKGIYLVLIETEKFNKTTKLIIK